MCFTIFSNGGGHLIDFAHNSDSGGKCVIALSPAPWRIGTLKYLEIEIKKWPSRTGGDKKGQIGLLKNVKDGFSRPLGSREIQKTKVCTVLPNTL